MARQRSAHNVGLPNRWVRRHGAIFYIVPAGMEPYWNNKTWFRLGVTEDEAWATWSRVAANQDAVEVPEVPDVNALPRTTLVRRGVYILRKGDEIVYIGRSSRLHERLHSHISSGIIDFDSYSAVAAEGLNQRLLEQALIAKHKPKFNIYEVE